MSLLKLNGKLSNQQGLLLGVGGFALLFLVWFLITAGEHPLFPSYILPKPGNVLSSFGSLYRDNDIIRNTCLSLGLNLAGYLEAILIAIPLGFLIGLIPLLKGLTQRQVDAIRYVPLTAVTGLFIVWFGTSTAMKVHFLAFGILIYLLPVVMVRVNEVEDVYLKTVYTLGASNWQTVKTVYIPSVLSRLTDDIRVLTAISWTYIIVAEGIGSTGGIGSLIWRAGIRQGRVDKVFAMLIIIMVIGIIQDKIFIYLDRVFFPHKYQDDTDVKLKVGETSTVDLIWNFITSIGVWIIIGIYLLLFIDNLVPVLGSQKILPYLFGDTTFAIHLIMWSVIGFQIYHYFRKRQDTLPAKKSVNG
ncbi:MAG: ABC transporter permease subunit [Saprospiraceae bacterium]|nr:ABC transporter permease subunit [Saprospiraceae bacterium]